MKSNATTNASHLQLASGACAVRNLFQCFYDTSAKSQGDGEVSFWRYTILLS